VLSAPWFATGRGDPGWGWAPGSLQTRDVPLVAPRGAPLWKVPPMEHPEFCVQLYTIQSFTHFLNNNSIQSLQFSFMLVFYVSLC